ETKTVVLEKLDAMGVELLIPQDLSGLFRVEFTSAEDGGTLYGNVTKFIKERRQWLSKHFSGNDVGFAWNIESNWVKSYYYDPFDNSFFITMYGFLGSHAKPDSPDEELLGYIGLTIAHEISHAFDNKGSLFNKYGRQEDLWTKEDRQEFNSRCMRLAQYMSNYEVYPGIVYTDGTQVVGECVADLTAMKCMMSIASQIPDFNYKTFFSCYAKVFVISFTRKAWENQLVYDPHPQGRSRVNRILSLVDEFYTTFDIQPGDAMYVAPQDRPVVW
ncbi:MAG: M13-type metalloendopeptidase, partial [Spirochaetales bacterium]